MLLAGVWQRANFLFVLVLLVALILLWSYSLNQKQNDLAALPQITPSPSNLSASPPASTLPVEEGEPTEEATSAPGPRADPHVHRTPTTRTQQRIDRSFNVPLLPFVRHHQRLHSDWWNNSNPQRYVGFSAIGGFGNRVYGLLSMILYSRFTQRALFLADWGDILLFYDLGLGNISASHLSAPRVARWDGCFWHNNGDTNSWRSTGDLNATYPIAEVWQTNCPLFSWLTRNPHYYPQLVDYGLIDAPSKVASLPQEDHQAIHFGMLRSLLRQYLRPQRELRLELEDLLEDQAGDVTCLIGVHLRMGGSNVNWADPERMPIAHLPLIWDCMRAMANGSLVSHCESRETVKFFLATDSPIAQKHALAEFSDQLIALNSSTIVHLDRGAAGTEGLRRTVLDVELLSLCDDLLVSYSTFGYVAAARRGIQPYRMINSACVRDPVVEDLG